MPQPIDGQPAEFLPKEPTADDLDGRSAVSSIVHGRQTAKWLARF